MRTNQEYKIPIVFSLPHIDIPSLCCLFTKFVNCEGVLRWVPMSRHWASTQTLEAKCSYCIDKLVNILETSSADGLLGRDYRALAPARICEYYSTFISSCVCGEIFSSINHWSKEVFHTQPTIFWYIEFAFLDCHGDWLFSSAVLLSKAPKAYSQSTDYRVDYKNRCIRS